MAKRKSRLALPRVTVLAMSRRELLAFVEAVNAMQFRVKELEEQIDRLKMVGTNGRKPGSPVKPRTDFPMDQPVA